MAMQYNQQRASVCALLRQFSKLLPFYWAAWLAIFPIEYLPCSDDPRRLTGLVQSFFLLWGAWPVHERPLLTHGWYLTAHLCFLVCFNPLSWLAGKVQPRSVRRLCLSLGATSMLTAAIHTSVYYAYFVKHSFSAAMFFNQWAPLRLPQFFMGVLVGKACLQIDLSQRNRRWLASIVDALFAAMVVASIYLPGLLYVFADLPVSLIVYGLLCTSTSWTARLLSSHCLVRFSSYTFELYIVHKPVLFWFSFVRNHGDGAMNLLSYDYRSADCLFGPRSCHVDALDVISFVCVSLIAAAIPSILANCVNPLQLFSRCAGRCHRSAFCSWHPHDVEMHSSLQPPRAVSSTCLAV